MEVAQSVIPFEVARHRVTLLLVALSVCRSFFSQTSYARLGHPRWSTPSIVPHRKRPSPSTRALKIAVRQPPAGSDTRSLPASYSFAEVSVQHRGANPGHPAPGSSLAARGISPRLRSGPALGAPAPVRRIQVLRCARSLRFLALPQDDNSRIRAYSAAENLVPPLRGSRSYCT